MKRIKLTSKKGKEYTKKNFTFSQDVTQNCGKRQALSQQHPVKKK